MVFVMSFFAGVGSFLFLSWLLIVKTQTPEAQLRKRLDAMIRQAESERAKAPKVVKKPKAIVTNEPAPQQAAKRNSSFFDRIIKPIWVSLDERFQKFAPAEIKLQLEDKIFRAGKTGVWDARRFITIWFLMILLGIAGAIFFAQGQELHPLQYTIIVFLGAFVGAMLPFAFLNSKIRQRQKSLRRQLPEFLDLLCVSVQAGLSFDGAVAKIVARMEGPLIDEFRRFQNDVGLGMTHQYALNQVAKRCDLEEVYLFTTSVIQSERLGTSMTRTLKVQADNMRDRHRQWVRGEALKAPVKIIFPMVLFIFPSIFVVLLFPSVLTIVRNLGG